jgi:hypothetical protein
MGTAAGVAATVRRPVWCGQRRSGGLPAAGSAKRTPPRCAHCADSRDRRRDRVGRLSHPTGQAVIVALRRAQRPVWAPGVRILGRPPIIRRRSRTSSIVDRAPIAWVRWGGPNREKTIAPPRSPQVVRSQETTPSGDSTEVPNRPFTAGTDQVLAEVVGGGVLRSLHPDARCRCPRRPRRWPGRDPLQRPPRAGRRWCAQPGAGLGSGGFGRACRRAVGPAALRRS